jgi:glycosyltransferase involved in cell wall biosynthesis
MKFAIIGARGYPSTYGGFETFVRKLAPALRARGHEITVYCRGMRGNGPRVREIDGVRCIDPPGIETKQLSTLSFGLCAVADACFRGYDAALVLNVANGLFLPVLERAGVRTVMNVDGIEWERGKWGWLAQRAFLAGAHCAARSATTLIADSRAIADIWHQKFARRPVFIPYGADVIEGNGFPKLAELGVEPGSYVLVVARLAPENNVELTLDAMTRLNGSHKLVIAGEANYRSALERRLLSLERRGRVLWLRHVHDEQLLGELWSGCAVYVHGHSVGGTNPALLQALGAGAPTLAFASPFNSEVLGDGDELYARDPALLARKVDDLLGDRGRRDDLTARGRQIVEERYRWDEVLDAYGDLLERVARGER